MKLTKERAEHYLLQMYQIRAFEEQAEKSYMAGKIHGTMHLSIGQEHYWSPPRTWSVYIQGRRFKSNDG